MKAKIRWIDDALFLGESGSGHALAIEGPPEAGGKNRGIRPMELLLLGLGSCSAFDVVHIIKKSRKTVADCHVEIQAERADTDPRVFTRIHLHYVISGSDLTEKTVERAVSLSAEKYCSASIMLGKAVDISHDFVIEGNEND